MGFLGLTELLLLIVLPSVALLIATFCLALAAFNRVKRLERRLDGPSILRH
jgi:hypothetical protein